MSPRCSRVPVPFGPWHATHFWAYTVEPWLTVPLPGGNSLPSGETAVSRALISSSLGVVPSRYVGPWANAFADRARTIAEDSSLEQRTLDASVPVDLPGLNAVEVVGLQEILRRHAEDCRRLGDG